MSAPPPRVLGQRGEVGDRAPQVPSPLVELPTGSGICAPERRRCWGARAQRAPGAWSSSSSVLGMGATGESPHGEHSWAPGGGCTFCRPQFPCDGPQGRSRGHTAAPWVPRWGNSLGQDPSAAAQGLSLSPFGTQVGAGLQKGRGEQVLGGTPQGEWHRWGHRAWLARACSAKGPRPSGGPDPGQRGAAPRKPWR